MKLVINSETTLAALLHAGAQLTDEGAYLLTFEGRAFEVSNRLAKKTEAALPAYDGWQVYRTVIETWTGQQGTGVNMRPVSKEFVLRTNAEMLIADNSDFIFEPDPYVGSYVEEIDIVWFDYYWRVISTLNSVNKTTLNRMRGKLLGDLANDMYRLAYGTIASYRVRYEVLNSDEYLQVIGDSTLHMNKQDMIAHVRILRHTAISRFEAIATEMSNQ